MGVLPSSTGAHYTWLNFGKLCLQFSPRHLLSEHYPGVNVQLTTNEEFMDFDQVN